MTNGPALVSNRALKVAGATSFSLAGVLSRALTAALGPAPAAGVAGLVPGLAVVGAGGFGLGLAVCVAGGVGLAAGGAGGFGLGSCPMTDPDANAPASAMMTSVREVERVVMRCCLPE